MEKNILELINIVNIIIRVWISYVVPLWKLGTVQHTRVWARGPFVCPEPKLTSHCVMSDSPESEPQSQHCIYLRFEVLPLLDQKGQTDGAGVLSFSLSSVSTSCWSSSFWPTHDYCTHANHHRGAAFWVLTMWSWTQRQEQSCKGAVTDN